MILCYVASVPYAVAPGTATGTGVGVGSGPLPAAKPLKPQGKNFKICVAGSEVR